MLLELLWLSKITKKNTNIAITIHSNYRNMLFIDKKSLLNIASRIQFLLNSIYPPFKKILPIDSFRYLFCGGANTIFDISLYFVLYNFVIQKKVLSLFCVSISPHILAFIIVFPITFFTSFLLSKYITFTGSDLKGRSQLFRFGLTILASMLLQYVLLKLFVDQCHLFPTPSKILVSAIIAVSSYFSHMHFSFEKKSKKQ